MILSYYITKIKHTQQLFKNFFKKITGLMDMAHNTSHKAITLWLVIKFVPCKLFAIYLRLDSLIPLKAL